MTIEEKLKASEDKIEHLYLCLDASLKATKFSESTLFKVSEDLLRRVILLEDNLKTKPGCIQRGTPEYYDKLEVRIQYLQTQVLKLMYPHMKIYGDGAKLVYEPKESCPDLNGESGCVCKEEKNVI